MEKNRNRIGNGLVNRMVRKGLALSVLVLMLVMVVMFSGCIESKTPIHDFYENPDKYVDKEVTITARTYSPFYPCTISRQGFPAYKPKSGKGFGIEDIGAYVPSSGISAGFEFNDGIWVEYSGNIPQREDFEGKWGKIESRTVRVKGIVRYAGGHENFYIEGESWKYID